MTIITPELRALRDAFLRHDRDIMLVGGAVRSMLLGEPASDIDLCTDATPNEQRAIYEEELFRHFPTGLKHGTWTVLLSDSTVVEVSSLRTERDGRDDPTWTRDWREDLARRDLTINAIAMNFDGEILDPFEGRADLERRVVRFVGDPAERIREDHLRILRFFRFHARIAGHRAYDAATLRAIQETMTGLTGIARERVWSEIALIIAGPYGIKTLRDIIGLGIAPLIDLPPTDWQFLQGEHQATHDPVSLMAAYLGNKTKVQAQAITWRWSVAERQQASFIASLLDHPGITFRQAQSLVTRGVMKYWLSEGLRLLDRNDEADALSVWPVPDFPVMGRDIVALGIAGAEIGGILRALQERWDESEFRLSRTALLNLVPMVRQHEPDLPSD